MADTQLVSLRKAILDAPADSRWAYALGWLQGAIEAGADIERLRDISNVISETVNSPEGNQGDQW